MALDGKTGKIKFIRVNDDKSHVWGPPTDRLHTEVIVQLDSAPDWAFGFDIEYGDTNLPQRLAMLSVLRDAYINKTTVQLTYNAVAGKKNVILRRVNLL